MESSKTKNPRWTEKSLAEAIAVPFCGSVADAMGERMRQADAVERLVRSGRRVWDLKARNNYTNDAWLKEWYAALDALGAEVEKAGEWTK